MFNVTVIKLKDIIKIIAIVSMIYILGNFVFKNIQYKNYFNQSININMDEFVKMGLNKESSIFRYISGEKEAEQERTEEVEADFKGFWNKGKRAKSWTRTKRNTSRRAGNKHKFWRTKNSTNSRSNDRYKYTGCNSKPNSWKI